MRFSIEGGSLPRESVRVSKVRLGVSPPFCQQAVAGGPCLRGHSLESRMKILQDVVTHSSLITMSSKIWRKAAKRRRLIRPPNTCSSFRQRTQCLEMKARYLPASSTWCAPCCSPSPQPAYVGVEIISKRYAAEWSGLILNVTVCLL